MPQQALSTDAKVTVQGLLKRFKVNTTAEGSGDLFSHPAISGLLQPFVTLLRSRIILDKVLDTERNCQDVLLDYVNNDPPKEDEDRAAEFGRTKLNEDKDQLVALSSELSTLESTYESYFEGLVSNKTVHEQFLPFKKDLQVAEECLKNLREELQLQGVDYATE